jgi:1,2-diacylglycerol 3-alpha-glucosyltransferase
MDHPLRVAIFTDSALPILNGVSVSVDSLIHELRNQGHSVHLFCPQFPRHRESDPNTYRFRAIETPWTKGFPFAYPPYIRILRKFRRHEFDLVHIHTLGIVGFIGLRWAESHELPLVGTYHTLYDRYAHYIPGVPRRYVRFKIAKHTNYVFNRVDQVITPSDASLKWLRRHAVTKPATVIPTGVGRRGFLDRSEVRQALGIPPEQKILLYVGRLAQEKNLPTLFQMAAQACQEDPQIRLWLVGDGPYRSQCMALARQLGIGDRVRFVGFVPHAEVERYYAAADLFVFSSVTETQGLVLQEAMAHGLPCIAISGGGASASIEDGVNGFIVRNEPGSFATSVLDLLDDDDQYARISGGAARTGREYGVGRMTERIVDIYRDAIAVKKGVVRNVATLR